MTKENRKILRDKIITALNQITDEVSNKQSVVEIGGHTCSRRLLYAGGSQWRGCGRDWDRVPGRILLDVGRGLAAAKSAAASAAEKENIEAAEIIGKL